METLVLHVDGMSCGHCLNAVNQALSELPGVAIESVRIGRAEVRYDPGKMSPDTIRAAIEEAGYLASELS